MKNMHKPPGCKTRPDRSCKFCRTSTPLKPINETIVATVYVYLHNFQWFLCTYVLNMSLSATDWQRELSGLAPIGQLPQCCWKRQLGSKKISTCLLVSQCTGIATVCQSRLQIHLFSSRVNYLTGIVNSPFITHELKIANLLQILKPNQTVLNLRTAWFGFSICKRFPIVHVYTNTTM